MRDLLKRYSSRREYRLVSLLLALAADAVPFSTALLPADAAHVDLWVLLAVLVSLPLHVALVVLTYYRFQRGGISSAWLFLMVLVFHVGPNWELAGPLTFHPSGLIGLVPVVIGWFAPDRNGIGPSRAKRDTE